MEKIGHNRDCQRSLEQVEAIVKTLPFGVVLTDSKKTVVYYNRMFEHISKKTGMENKPLTLILDHEILEEAYVGSNVHLSINGEAFVVRKEYVYIDDQEHILYLLSSVKELENLLHINRKRTELLEEVMEFANDGIIMVDQEGYITMLSKEYGEFLQLDPNEVIGRHVTDVVENTRMHLVAKSGKAEVADLQKIKGDYMIATRVPIIKNGEIKGAVGKVLFQNVGGFTSLYKRVNMMEKELKRYKGEWIEQNKARYTFQHLIGKSERMLRVKREAERASLTNSSVLLLGESGTGKELFAHSIHHASSRSSGSFVKVNCAAIPADLLESELFGYEEGSFTGAKKGGKKGKFEAADGGTIFLDEIGELALHMQVKLLRVLQEKEIEKIGSTTTTKVDVRIIAATNRDLEDMVQKGEFRLDLFYRLNVVSIRIPSLRERDQDVLLLGQHFIEKLNKMMQKDIQGITKEANQLLLHYQWAGNIRELENVIERAMNLVEGKDKQIDLNHLPEKMTMSQELKPLLPLSTVVELAEREAIHQALTQSNGNRSKAAQLLNISRSAFYEKLAKYDLV